MMSIARAALAGVAACALIGADTPPYQPRETFAPFDMQQAVNGYRSSNGLPGPRYWQNRAD